MPSRTAAFAAAAAIAVGLVATPAAATPTEQTTPVPTIAWAPCEKDASAQCGTLSVPVDWNRPDGPRFGLAVARRAAADPSARLGSMVFGPGGPGDSGVTRILTGMHRFSPELRRRFDIVSFDPRGIGASNPVVCSADLLAQRPEPVLTSQADFDATVAYNRKLRADCRERTGPVFDHVDTLQMVKDLDALRAALGEEKLTFHGSSYGTLLGEQYAEVFPGRIRAMVLESVVDHSLGTRAFLETQAATVEDSFDEFVAWCDRAPACALHGQDVRAIWHDLLGRAERGELSMTPFALSVRAQARFYGPEWARFARELQAMNAPTATRQQNTPTATPQEAETVPTAETAPFDLAVFCQDWNLPVRDYREYARQVRRLAAVAPDMRYPRALMALSLCLGSPPVDNPQHRLTVRGSAPILLTNSMHDPATPYRWATNVLRQIGDEAVLLTYEGWGHGTYNSTPCAQVAIDRYLISLAVPAAGTSCAAVEPA